ncbi:hypothetical protein V8H18_14020 [Lautropia mirabilis]
MPTSVKGLPRILLVSMGHEDTIKAPRFAEAVRSAFRAVLASPATDAFCCLHEAHVELRELPGASARSCWPPVRCATALTTTRASPMRPRP